MSLIFATQLTAVATATLACSRRHGVLRASGLPQAVHDQAAMLPLISSAGIVVNGRDDPARKNARDL